MPITGYVVLLHGNFVVHGQELWQGDFVSYKYRDHSLWNNAFLVELMDYLLEKAEARSIPALDEFAWRMDKVSPLEQHLLHCARAVTTMSYPASYTLLLAVHTVCT